MARTFGREATSLYKGCLHGFWPRPGVLSVFLQTRFLRKMHVGVETTVTELNRMLPDSHLMGSGCRCYISRFCKRQRMGDLVR